MKKGVKIAIIVGVIVLAIIFAGGYLVMNDIIQKAKIVEEFAQMEQITNSEDFNIETLNEKTSNIVSSGKYATIEKAAKTYIHDLFNVAFEIRTMLQDEKMAQLLTASNYSEDGPEFVESKKYLTETKQKLEEGKQEMLSYLEESKINSYIEAETKDAYAIDLYKQLLAEDIEKSKSQKDELEKSINKVVSMLETEEEVIDFLIKNNGKWQVQGGQVVFNSNSLVIQYNAFLTKLRIL